MYKIQQKTFAFRVGFDFSQVGSRYQIQIKSILYSWKKKKIIQSNLILITIKYINKYGTKIILLYKICTVEIQTVIHATRKKPPSDEQK